MHETDAAAGRADLGDAGDRCGAFRCKRAEGRKGFRQKRCIGIVLHDLEIMLARNPDQILPLFGRHGVGCGVLHIGHQKDTLDAVTYGGLCKGVRVHGSKAAVGPNNCRHGDRLQSDARERRKDGRICKPIDSNRVTAAKQRLTGHLNAVLRPAGHGDPVRVCLQAIVLEDKNTCFPMGLQSLRRDKPVQPVDADRPCHTHQAIGQAGIQMRVRKIPGEITNVRFVFLRYKR